MFQLVRSPERKGVGVIRVDFGPISENTLYNNNTLTNNILLKRFSNTILPWHTQHTNISHTSTCIRFLQADDNSSTNTLDFNQYTINSHQLNK
jgi:hypothetical protein